MLDEIKASLNYDGSLIDIYTTKSGMGIYKPATGITLNTIRQRNQTGKVTFLLASQPFFTESAQAAYLLCEYINATKRNGVKKVYETFFATHTSRRYMVR
ncbi:MAG: hypothetical protein ACRERU_19255 [Methylococcales bacterium]